MTICNQNMSFAKLMNKYAFNLGMHNTTFKNASGLPNRAQMTTARDIAILSHAIIKNFPDKYLLFSKRKFTWKGKTYKTHNKLMLSYNGADGIKTGYIKASGFQLAFSAKRKNKRLIGVYFGGEIAAPVFSKVMEVALRKFNISPDMFKHKDIHMDGSQVAWSRKW